MRPDTSDLLYINDEEFEALSHQELFELANKLKLHVEERATKERLKTVIRQSERKK